MTCNFDSLPKDAAPAEDAPPGKVRATPRVKMLAKKLGVDLTEVTGSGNNGRITESDVKAYADETGGPLNEDVRSTPAVSSKAAAATPRCPGCSRSWATFRWSGFSPAARSPATGRALIQA